MATLDDLRDRIIRETNRDELTDAPNVDNLIDANATTLDLCIQRAVDYYANQRFFFNETTTTLSAISGTQAITYPSGYRSIDRLSVNIGGNRYGLQVQDWITIDQWLGWGTANGQPTDYSVSNGVITLYPIPNDTYMLTVLGISDVTPALDYSDGASSNAWTNEAQDLIAYRTRFLLLRDYFRDPDGASLAAGAEQEALAKLRAQTANQISTNRIRGAW
jgi:hypothetical protein